MQRIGFYTYKKIKALGDNAFHLACATELLNSKLTNDAFIIHPLPLFKEQYEKFGINSFDIDKKDATLLNNSIIFMPANEILCFLADIHKCQNISNIKIALIFSSPYGYNWLFNQIKVKDKNEFIDYFVRKKSILFQDFTCYFPIKQYLNKGKKITPRYVPLSTLSNVESRAKPIINNSINIAWVGRIDIDKYFSFTNLCNSLLKVNINKNINLHIIGGGTLNKSFDIDKYKGKITFIWTSFLSPSELENYLTNKVDICVSMGTSSIKCAQLAIPTVIPIVENKPFNDDSFVYFFDTKKYSICWDRKSIKEAKCKTNTIGRIIYDVYVKQRKVLYGNKCKRKTKIDFNIQRNISSIYKNICMTKLNAQDLLDNPLIKRKLRYFDLVKKTLYKRYKTFEFSEYVIFYNMCKKFKKATLSSKLKKIFKFVFVKKFKL